MNIFGIGGAELVLIVLIMLVVAGPKRMLRWAYILGQWIGRFRHIWEEAVDVMQKEVDAAGMEVKIPKDFPTRQSVSRMIEDAAKPYTDQTQQALDDLRQPLQTAVDETKTTVKAAQDETRSATKVEMGAWSDPGKGNSSDDAPSSASKPPVSDFGAWSQPQGSDERTTDEAQS